MRHLTFATCMLAITLAASAQTPGAITGTVSDPEGAPVANAPVQGRNVSTGSTYRAFSSATGAFLLPQVPSGTYELSVAMPCCAYNPYLRENVVVGASQTVRIDIRLREGGSLRTLGDDPGTLADPIRRNAPKSGRAPRTANGKPDLSGVWLGNDDLFPEQPALLPAAAAIASERVKNDFKDHPHSYCLPAGVPQVGPFLIKFVQTPTLIVALFEDVPGFRQIFLDGRAHPKDVNPTWLGHSIGRWEGDTLVVDTVGFNDKSWLGAAPHSEAMHVVERFRRPELGRMEVEVTVDDAEVLAKPWKIRMTWHLAVKEDVLEYVCTENNRAREHVVGK